MPPRGLRTFFHSSSGIRRWVCTDARGMVRDYEGLSKDVSKLPHYVESGSSALCLDTSELYEYHKPTDTWYKL